MLDVNRISVVSVVPPRSPKALSSIGDIAKTRKSLSNRLICRMRVGESNRRRRNFMELRQGGHESAWSVRNRRRDEGKGKVVRGFGKNGIEPKLGNRCVADTSSKLERTKSKDKITETLVRINSDRRCVAQDSKEQSEMRFTVGKFGTSSWQIIKRQNNAKKWRQEDKSCQYHVTKDKKCTQE